MRKGQKASEETRRKMSESAKNRSAEHRRKLSEALKGRAPSPQCMEASRKLMTGQVGEEARHWKGGRRVSSHGYVGVLKDGTGSYAYEHRKVMEQVLGRALRRGEVVHHIDGDKTNNSPENLEVFASNAEHLRHHAQARKAA
jgi:hypothetical protein